LGIQASESQVRGTTRFGYKVRVGGWFLSSKGQIESKDVRRHIDWILEQFAGSYEELRQLQAEGYRIDIFCYWLSRSGHGGPTLGPLTMRRLAEANLQLGLDIYFPSVNEQ